MDLIWHLTNCANPSGETIRLSDNYNSQEQGKTFASLILSMKGGGKVHLSSLP